METIFMNNKTIDISDIDAQIAIKNAEIDKLRLELEQLKAKKMKL